MEHSVNVREALQREFMSRCRRNRSYSLRAFAKNLEIDQSYLSKLLRGKRDISIKISQEILQKLGFTRERVEKSHETPKYLNLSNDEFEVISSWHYFAILELMKLKSFKPNIRFIADRLGLHLQEVEVSLTILERLKFIRRDRKKWHLVSRNNTWTNSKNSSFARKKLQGEILELSLRALENVSFENREHSSTTIAIDKTRLPEFKEKLKKFQHEISEFMQPTDKDGNYNEVYQLALSLFPLTHLGEQL
ncbi:MAG: TIGR02147 family protein [Pseudomonadota bacterium]|nr:TIGR02147 family protein [Pseudomonadota bacterium]